MLINFSESWSYTWARDGIFLFVTRGRWIQILSPQVPGPLGSNCSVAFVIHTTPITEVAQPVLPCLPGLLTILASKQDAESPRSATEWSTPQGGGEVPTGLILQWMRCYRQQLGTPCKAQRVDQDGSVVFTQLKIRLFPPHSSSFFSSFFSASWVERTLPRSQAVQEEVKKSKEVY